MSSFTSPKVAYISIAENGSYKERINEIANIIRERLRSLGMNPLFQATDSDRGVSNLHNEFFKPYFVKKGQIRFRDF